MRSILRSGVIDLSLMATSGAFRLSLIAAVIFDLSLIRALGAPEGRVADYWQTAARPDDYALRAVSPEILELSLTETKPPDPVPVARWNFVGADGTAKLPAAASLVVSADDERIGVRAVGFKRRASYAPAHPRDLRASAALYIHLDRPLRDGETITVTNPDATLWPADWKWKVTVAPNRWSPAIHVNQGGFQTNWPKQAMVGYYLGNLGELIVDPSAGFDVVDTASGEVVFRGRLIPRREAAFPYSAYQQVMQADFTAVRTSGEYQLRIPGLGVSYPFTIGDGVAALFARSFALGLYHQRCGTNNPPPYTRFTHDACHLAEARVPVPQGEFPFTWQTIARYSAIKNTDRPPSPAPRLAGEDSQLYPFRQRGTIDVSGGHHDAGDYSKYTINSASLIHLLVFAVDALPGVAELDNLGIPESGDGISDVLQEAKWEADFLAKMQDDDGGFYFLVYPQNREYESEVLPDHGDPQVVWPKNTAATAAAIAALAQTASSPHFRHAYPDVAAQYLARAKRGWKFLTDALAQHGGEGAYQKLTHYGDNFGHEDELAWAATELFLATGDPAFQQQLLTWLPNPGAARTAHWGWWRLYAAYGNVLRSYAFAVRSGRLSSLALDNTYRARCEDELIEAADDHARWAAQSAYGTSLPEPTKRTRTGGWYFSTDAAFDLAVALQLTAAQTNSAHPNYLLALLTNLNHAAGTNPTNFSHITGLGWHQPEIIVHQYAANARRSLPPTGLLVGDVQAGFAWMALYQRELSALSFPSDGDNLAPFPLYDRGGDVFNPLTEGVVLNQAKALATTAWLMAQSPLRHQAWGARRGEAEIASVSSNDSSTSSRTVEIRFNGAAPSERGLRFTWETNDRAPWVTREARTSIEGKAPPAWVEVEVLWPDGRRVFAQSDQRVVPPVIPPVPHRVSP